MKKKPAGSAVLLAALLFSGFVAQAQVAETNLAPYSQLETVEGIFSNPSVVGRLKTLLAGDYAAFSGNFDVFGEPHRTPTGGLFVEGWLQDLRLEQASAFVIEPDGGIAAAWIMPDQPQIQYRSSSGLASGIQPDIAAWATRFEHATFSRADARQTQAAK